MTTNAEKTVRRLQGVRQRRDQIEEFRKKARRWASIQIEAPWFRRLILRSDYRTFDDVDIPEAMVAEFDGFLTHRLRELDIEIAEHELTLKAMDLR